MEFVTSSHRNGLALIESDPDLGSLWQELIKVIQSISDEEILMKFRNNAREAKSISEAINDLIDEKLGKKSEDNEMLDEISKVPEESFKEPNE